MEHAPVTVTGFEATKPTRQSAIRSERDGCHVSILVAIENSAIVQSAIPPKRQEAKK
jgi:hypothetical protein